MLNGSAHLGVPEGSGELEGAGEPAGGGAEGAEPSRPRAEEAVDLGALRRPSNVQFLSQGGERGFSAQASRASPSLQAAGSTQHSPRSPERTPLTSTDTRHLPQGRQPQSPPTPSAPPFLGSLAPAPPPGPDAASAGRARPRNAAAGATATVGLTDLGEEEEEEEGKRGRGRGAEGWSQEEEINK